jgi:hypothetical protein
VGSETKRYQFCARLLLWGRDREFSLLTRWEDDESTIEI